MLALMRIGSRAIAPKGQPYIIAEIGVNHDGDPARAMELVEGAHEAGADAAKFQFFEADRLMSAASKLAAYQASAGERDPIEMLRRLQLSVDELRPAVERAHALGLHAIVSVFSVELVQGAERLPWDAYKTASPDVVNRPLLDTLAATRRPLIVSTGAATLEEVKTAVEWMRPSWDRLALLHCVSSYPTPSQFASLPAMNDLSLVFDGPIGYSDHTEAVDTGALAVHLGAVILEKHLTYDRAAHGPDHRASLNPSEFKQYVAAARLAASGHGNWNPADQRLAIRHKSVLAIEHDVREVSRQSVVAVRDIAAGEVIRRSDLTLKRPGGGLKPSELPNIIGRVATRPVRADHPVLMDDVADMALWSAA